MKIERVSIAIEEALLRRFDRLLARKQLGNRSEAIRDLIRRRLVDEETRGRGEAVASLTLVYDHAQRELSDKLVSAGHEHHARFLATLHVHLDRHLCLEVIALQGRPAALRALADRLIGLKGVKHGELVMSSARLWAKKSEGGREHPHEHPHEH